MKRNALIRIILWSIVIAILTTLMLGVGFGISFNRNRSIFHAEQNVTPDATEVGNHYSATQGRDTFPASEIRKLKIEWAAGDIKIYPGNTDQITVSEDYITDDKYTMVVRQEGSTLKVKFSQDESNIFALNTVPSKDLTITVPVDWYCDSLEIDAAAATVEVCDLNMNEVDFDGASGTCEFENCSVDQLDIDTASGDVRFVGSLNILDCDAASASVYAVLSNVPSRMDMDTMSGDLELTLPGDAGFTLSMNAMSDDFTSEFETVRKNGKYVCGDGFCRISIDALSGDVILHKGA